MTSIVKQVVELTQKFIGLSKFIKFVIEMTLMVSTISF
jgi:hypothetical protein